MAGVQGRKGERIGHETMMREQERKVNIAARTGHDSVTIDRAADAFRRDLFQMNVYISSVYRFLNDGLTGTPRKYAG